MSRREIREHIFKLLFLLEFYKGEELNEQAERYLDEVEEAVPTEEEAAYIRDRLVRRIYGKHIYHQAGKPLYQQHVYPGFYVEPDLCEGRSVQL